MRMPVLADQLGPVGSTSLRVASRVSNLLRAGRPVADFGPIRECGLVLMSTPSPETFVDRMLAASVDWRGAVILLCDPILGSETLHRLAAVGAYTGSLSPVEGLDGLFLVEGHPRAQAEARRIAECDGGRSVRIDTQGKSLYVAGLSIARCLALPLVTACAESLRAAGLPQNLALDLTERTVQRTLRAYRKGGRKGWEGPLARKENATVGRIVAGLDQANPLLANYYEGNARLALRLLKQDDSWLERTLQPSPKKLTVAVAS